MQRETNIFDIYADFYGDVKPRPYDYFFINFIKSNKTKYACLLDVGGGQGTFACLVKNRFPEISVTVVDPSQKLLDIIKDDKIIKINGNLPYDLNVDSNFDYIHIKEVFHHIVGSTINESRELTRVSLRNIWKILNDDGFIMIHELFYDGYLFPTLPRMLIFYLLSLQNTVRFRIPVKEFLMDLKVCFYTREEFNSLLTECGFKLINYHVEYWGETWKKNILFLKDWGRMLFIAKKIESKPIL